MKYMFTLYIFILLNHCFTQAQRYIQTKINKEAKNQNREKKTQKKHKHIHEYMSMYRNDKLNPQKNYKKYLYINERHTCHDDIGSKHTQQKQI